MFWKSTIKNRVFIILLMVVLLSGLALGQEAKAPKILIKEKLYNAGVVMEGTSIEHTYTVYNRGNDQLRILKVKPG